MDMTELTSPEAALGPVRSTGMQLLAQAEAAVIDSDDSAGKAGDLIKYVKGQLAKSEDARTALVKPLNDHVKFINAQFKAAQDAIVKAEGIVRNKLNAYLAKKEQERRDEEARQRKAAEDEALRRAEQAAATGNAAAADQHLEAAIAAPPVVAKAPVRGDFGSTVTSRKVWTFAVEDLAKVPREYLVLDERKVREAINRGERSIPGLKIEETVQAAVR